MTTATTRTPAQEARRRSTVVWVVSLAFVGLVFDGYDLVVYGTVLSTFLRDPTQIGVVTPAVGGALSSYALVGVLAGALLAGTMSDVLGRRTLMLLSYAWFSVGMAVTALMSTTTGFGLMRFVTGLGVGALVATTGAIVSEFAPPGKKNLCNAIVYCGVPFGSLLSALTWLPELMTRAGFSTKGSLSFLLVLNGGAVIGALAGSRFADRFGPKPVVAACFLIGALSISLLTLSLPLGLLLLFVAIVGLGTSGTQTLIYGFVANYFTTKVRGAAVAWCAGFGRLGGVGGPLLGGLLVSAGLALNSIFYVLAGVALLGVVLTLLVPTRHTQELHAIPVEPSRAVGQAAATGGGRPTA